MGKYNFKLMKLVPFHEEESPGTSTGTSKSSQPTAPPPRASGAVNNILESQHAQLDKEMGDVFSKRNLTNRQKLSEYNRSINKQLLNESRQKAEIGQSNRKLAKQLARAALGGDQSATRTGPPSALAPGSIAGDDGGREDTLDFDDLTGAQKANASLLFNYLKQKHPKQIAFNPITKEVSIESGPRKPKKRLVGSNYEDLIEDLVSPKSERAELPWYGDEFYRFLAKLDLPTNLVKNKNRLDFLAQSSSAPRRKSERKKRPAPGQAQAAKAPKIEWP